MKLNFFMYIVPYICLVLFFLIFVIPVLYNQQLSLEQFWDKTNGRLFKVPLSL